MKRLTKDLVERMGWTPIRYHMPPPQSQVRHGWIVARTESGGAVIRLVGIDRNLRIPATEMRYVTEI